MSNKILGREGSLVRRKYGRYQFDNLEAAKNYIATIRNDQHEMQQPEEKYRGIAEHFRMCGNILRNPLRSSLWVEMCAVKERIQEKLIEIFEDEMPVMYGLGDLVAPKFVIDANNAIQTKHKPPER